MPSSSFDTIGSQATVHLATLPATITLPSGTVNDVPVGEVEVSGWADDGDRWTLKSPVRIDKPNRSYAKAPQGMRLLVDGEAVKYRAKPRPEKRGWTWQKGELILTLAGQAPNTHSVVLEATHLADRMKRLEPGLSGLSDAAYVQYSVTVKTRTRAGLLLAAPGSMSWDLAVPEGARLETMASLVNNGLTHVAGNGATVVLEVDGNEVARRFTDDTTLKSWTVDLSAFGGQTVNLTLRVDPNGDTAWDHLFLASPMLVGTPKDTVRRVVVIGVDTLRYDQVTQHGYERDTTAELQPFADSSVIFDDAWTTAPRTRPSFRSSTTGAYPFAAIDAPTFGEVFQEAGFVTGGVTANVHLVPDQGFTDGFDFWQFDNSRDADIQIRRAKQFLTDNKDRDTFLFLHLMDPHNFYRAPGLWANRYVEHERGNADHMLNRWQLLQKPLTDTEKEWLRDRYDGEIAFMAHELSRFIQWLTQQDGETLVAMHSDHGEEFWEHGSYEHNHTLYNEVVKANLWIRPPGGWAGGQRVPQTVSLVDMAPTLYDYAGTRMPEEVDGVSLRPLMDATVAARKDEVLAILDERPVQIGHLMYDRELWGVVGGGWKYTVRTCDGDQELYNLVEDPKEQDNRIADVAPAEVDARLADLATATSFSAGMGYRVEVIANPGAFGLDFATPVEAAVMDPEACKSRRANVEWGDMPDFWAEDVGDVTVNSQGVGFLPGSHGRGKLVVLSSSPPTALRVGTEVLENPPLNKLLVLGGVSVRIEPGPVLIQTDSVAARLGLPDTDGGFDDEQIRMLQELGYMGDDEDSNEE
jgi:arylsulfatase A-like enzyme